MFEMFESTDTFTTPTLNKMSITQLNNQTRGVEEISKLDLDTSRMYTSRNGLSERREIFIKSLNSEKNNNQTVPSADQSIIEVIPRV